MLNHTIADHFEVQNIYIYLNALFFFKNRSNSGKYIHIYRFYFHISNLNYGNKVLEKHLIRFPFKKSK